MGRYRVGGWFDSYVQTEIRGREGSYKSSCVHNFYTTHSSVVIQHQRRLKLRDVQTENPFGKEKVTGTIQHFLLMIRYELPIV